MLRRIPAKHRRLGDIFVDQLPKSLDSICGPAPDKDDDYHVTINIRSVYWTMDDIKNYIKASNPDLDFSTWSMTGGHGGRPITASFNDGTVVEIPEYVYDAMASEHVNANRFEDVQDSWSIELPYGNHIWLEPILPCYVNAKMLASLYKYRLAFARKSDHQDLLDRISDAGYENHMEPDILGFLADGFAYAKNNRCALWACLIK